MPAKHAEHGHISGHNALQAEIKNHCYHCSLKDSLKKADAMCERRTHKQNRWGLRSGHGGGEVVAEHMLLHPLTLMGFGLS